MVYTPVMDTQIDFLAIGDIVTDAFIRIKDAEATCDLDKRNCRLCVRFGDKVPYESMTELRAVGNSANAAVSAARRRSLLLLASGVRTETQGRTEGEPENGGTAKPA